MDRSVWSSYNRFSPFFAYLVSFSAKPRFPFYTSTSPPFCLSFCLSFSTCFTGQLLITASHQQPFSVYFWVATVLREIVFSRKTVLTRRDWFLPCISAVLQLISHRTTPASSIASELFPGCYMLQLQICMTFHYSAPTAGSAGVIFSSS